MKALKAHINEELWSTDHELVENVLAGDKDSFCVLVEKYQNKAVSIAYGIVGNLSDAEELAQEAFLKAYKNLASFRGQASFYTWLYRIIFNLGIDLSRKRYRKNENLAGDMFSAENQSYQAAGEQAFSATQALNPEADIMNAQLNGEIEKALNSLSPDHKAVIILREIQGLSYEEISVVMNCSKGTVMSRLHHARRNLQQALQNYYDNDRG
ncbi:MAG: sigma-70 family RNA polymerase sigma factor [Deltaproteobacteria bacterium]|nr:sigma-70 family RNA polymerase sigma factor [Deltaproteobacteria bacterium]